MKTLRTITQTLVISLLLLAANATLNTAQAQYNFTAGEYYNQQHRIQDIPVGYPYPKYDYYGRFMGTYQVWQRANWHGTSGGNYVNIWGPYGWTSQWVSGYVYWFEWVNYERRVG